MSSRHFIVLIGVVVCTFVLGTGGCAKSRVEMLRDRSALVEQKLGVERNRVLSQFSGQTRDTAISHLQGLRGALSVVNVSITTVPLFLQDPAQREVGYSVLDEAIGTIDWNIPLGATTSSDVAGSLRAYPGLFSPQSGLNFSAIQGGARPQGIAK